MKLPKPIHGITSPEGTRPIRTWCGRPIAPHPYAGALKDQSRTTRSERLVTCQACRRVLGASRALEDYHYKAIPDAPPLCLRCGLAADVHGHGEGGSHEASLPIEQRASHPFES